MTAGTFFQFDGAITEVAFQNLVRDAFAAWEKVANIDFVEVADSAVTDIRLGWDAIDGPNGYLGEAYVTWDGKKAATHGEIRFDTVETWSLSKSHDAAANFYALALHEIGHIIGFDHSDESDTIMFPVIGEAITLSAADIAGAQQLYGAPATTPGVPAGEPFDAADMHVVAATYQFFTGSVPSVEGFAYLIRSDANTSDLNDAYYSAFNQENRFINFSTNLGASGSGATMFDAAFADISFERAVALAYDEIIGTEHAAANGVDVAAALAFFQGSHDFYESVALERVVPSGIALDDATKVVMIGSMLNESMKAGLGQYAEAIGDFVDNHHASAGGQFGSDLLAA